MAAGDQNKDGQHWFGKLLSGKKSDKKKKKLKLRAKELFSISVNFDSKHAEEVLLCLSGGVDPDEYLKTLKTYDQSPVCGLVWNANFFAYRCRDCSISPCMSICADCFLQGNHEGHDFNMFKSQAGGACDCGDETVMKAEGFCSKHGDNHSSSIKPEVPEEILIRSKLLLPQLVHYLYECLKSHLASDGGSMSNVIQPLINPLKVLNKVTDIDFLRDIICQTIMDPINDMETEREVSNLVSIETTNGNKIVCTAKSETPTATFRVPNSPSCEYQASQAHRTYQSQTDKSETQRLTYLEYFIDILVRAEFPNELSTFLLELLPNPDYKEYFARLFCRQYIAIGNSIITSLKTEALSNHMVHVSVQLFSNENVALTVVKEENLLSKMIFVLEKMVRECIEDKLVQFEDSEKMISLVDCDKRILSHHCFWPFASDFTNIISHESVAKIFLENESLLSRWILIVKSLTAININTRRYNTHVVYEPRTYFTAFSVEFESVAAVMWELYRSVLKMNDKFQTLRLIKVAIEILKTSHPFAPTCVNDNSVLKLRKSCFTIHLPLLRYIALFISQAVNHFDMSLLEILDVTIIPTCLPYLVNAVAALQEIRQGFWVFNGHQIRCQAQSYLQSYFCNSMLDLDLFMLQICVAVMDEEDFVNLLIDRFSIRPWLNYGEPCSKLFAKDEEIDFFLSVEGFINLIILLLTHQVYSGASETEMLRKDVIAALCVADRTHSQLIDCIPSRPGDSHTPSRDGSIPGSNFDSILAEVADYKAPVVESSTFQQGKYSPKEQIWRDEYNFDHIQLRVYKKGDQQIAQERYNEYIQKQGLSTTSSTWPPTRHPNPMNPSFQNVFRLLRSQTVQKILVFILYKYTEGKSNISESLLISTYRLIHLSLSANIDHIDKAQVRLSTNDFKEHLLEETLKYFDSYAIDEVKAELHFNAMKEILIKEGQCCRENEVIEKVQEIFQSSLFTYLLNDMSTIPENERHQDSNSRQQYVKQLLLLMPEKKRLLLKGMVQYWYFQTWQYTKCIKDFAFVRNYEAENKPMGDLLTYLFNHFDYLFQVCKSDGDLPLDAISDIHFTSSNLKDNLLTRINIGSNATHCLHSVDCFQKRQERKKLVKQFSEITACNEATACQYIEWYSGNIQNALTSYVSKMEVDKDTSMEIDFVDEDSCSSMTSEASISNNASINFVSLLIKLRKLLIARRTSQIKELKEKPLAGDGVFAVTNLLLKISHESERVKKLVNSTCPEIFDKDSSCSMSDQLKSPQEKLKEMKRKKAKELQKKLLADFALQQKKFMQAMEGAQSMDTTDAVIGKEEEEEHIDNGGYECVICGHSALSTEDKPLGMIALIMASTVHGHRTLEKSSREVVKYVSMMSARKSELLKLFDQNSVHSAYECGMDCGINIQSCGHYVHIECHTSYFQSLRQESQALLNTTKGEFSCPFCRQLSNAVLPILPETILNSMHQKKLSNGNLSERCNELNSFLFTHYHQGGFSLFSRRSLNVTVLTESLNVFTALIADILRHCSEEYATFYHMSHRQRDRFMYMVATLRCNLESIYDIKVLQRKPIMLKTLTSLLESFNFHAQSCTTPMYKRWIELTTGSYGTHKSQKERSFGASDLKTNNVPIVLSDPINILVQFVVSWPQKITKDEYLLLVQLLYNLTYVQALIHIGLTLQPEERQGWINSDKEDMALTSFASQIWFQTSYLFQGISTASHIEISQNVVTPEYVEDEIQKRCKHFLHFSNILLHVLDIKESHTVQCQSFHEIATHLLSIDNTVKKTSTGYLQWPKHPNNIIKEWCNGLASKLQNRQLFSRNILPIMSIYQQPSLIKLPSLFESLFQQYRKTKCKNCRRIPEEPTLCLVCGEFLCFHAQCCEKDNVCETVQHSIDCGCGTGVFLVISSSITFLIREERVCMWGSVYLDAFGEEDKDLRRGKPLFLSEERYKKLEEEWRNHTLDKSAKRWVLHLNRL